MVPNKKLQSKSKEIGKPGYINPNCWLAKSINACPAKRCQYCETIIQECPIFRYLIVTLILTFVSLCIIFLTEENIPRGVILSLFLFIVSYGYFLSKSTEELILANFSLRETKKALEESKSALEIRVKARTKEIQKLANSLERQVKKRTKALQEKIEELEKFRKLTIGRELKMVELKKEIQILKKH